MRKSQEDQARSEDQPELSTEQLDAEQAIDLPQREAMSLIDPSLLGGGAAPTGGAVPTSGGAPDAGSAAPAPTPSLGLENPLADKLVSFGGGSTPGV